ncbi:MAG: TIGR02391 family protein [Candidatus Korobacteraceae bacterium]
MAEAGIELAAIEYVGIAGISKECQDAVLRLIQFGERITRARVLSCSNMHCFLLTYEVDRLVAVKSGFASGYGGEGPRRFSYVLQILDSHGVEIEEYNVSHELLDRVDSSALTRADLEVLDGSNPCHPSRWYDYVLDCHFEDARKGTLWQEEFPLIIPLVLVDSRIMDLALSFWDDPDSKLMLGYRRLEDIVRGRTGSEQHGAKLFSQAFNPSGGVLTWIGDDGECSARMQLFTATYGAHRNPRAHRELGSHAQKLLSEFLLLNHLYRLERDSVANIVGRE